MELKLSFVNKIKQANIKLNGLTVIAGPNSSGKSTIGRTLFSVVKAIANTKNAGEEDNKRLLRKHIESFYSRLQGLNHKIDYDSYGFPRFSNDFEKLFIETEDKDKFISNVKNILWKHNLVPRQRKLLEEDLENIRICWDNKDNPAASLKTELQYLIESEFMNTLCSVGHETTSVELQSEGNPRICFEAMNNQIVKVFYDEKNPFISDATYIESPLYVHLADAIMAAKTWRETEGRTSFASMPIVPSHIKDMVEKVVWASQQPDRLISSKINMNDITGGKMDYDTTSHQLVFKEGNNSFTTVNVASGIKSLSIVQLLENTKIIGPERLLIWDEPENHLHPEWQVRFAEKLVNLANSGIPILVTTHSPYFLQAIRYYSAIEKMSKYTNFYTPEEDEKHLETMTDVTDDLTSVFAKLAEPLNHIMDIVDYKE